MTTQIQRPTTAAFQAQATISFGVSLAAVGVGVVYLPLGPWERGFLGLGVLFLISSSFTLAKCVRDRQETQEISHRVEQARVDKLLTEHDPLELRT
ncbi:YiaA/YiaB family inner membrane protein [Streptomyces sp. Z26]|uniref:YiaA/YiaB family inner membrane protein n=1 Tax=Streptomyces TaxID=1883 RepID=UPI000EF16670|nr:YiaA/YiaB family inner membrane protein [Streptomyces sp. Z26]RLL70864.1 hypothetical protein D7M15_27405 [Streptomyces sp. Z26]